MKKSIFLVFLIILLTSCSDKPDSTAVNHQTPSPETSTVADKPVQQNQPIPNNTAEDNNITLAKKSGCWACHRLDKKLVGPAWADVGKRYAGQDVLEQLVTKVKKGGKGNWEEVTGGVAMPPNSPRVSDQDIETLVKYILSLRQ